MTPATAAANLVAVACAAGFTTRSTAPPGTALELWATTARPPRWAAYAAALWLKENASVEDPRQQAALAQVLLQIETQRPDVSNHA